MVTVHADSHALLVRAPSVFPGAATAFQTAPAVFERTDEDFIDAIYSELRSPEGLQKLRKTMLAPADDTQPWKLHPPLHQTFYIAMMEVACETYGLPRYDPKKIDSAGIVVRRVAADVNGAPFRPERLQGWMRRGKALQGWASFEHDSDLDFDPDSDHRLGALRSGNLEINRRLVRLRERTDALTESVSPAFVAPPDICDALGRTIVFGTIPASSFESSETEPPPKFSDDEVLRDYPTYFRSGAPRAVNPSNKTLTWENAADADVQSFASFIRQVGFTYGAFGKEPEAVALFQLLNTLDLNEGKGAKKPAGDFIRQAFTVLIEQRGKLDGSGGSVTMPERWPAVSSTLAGNLLRAVKLRLEQRLSALSPAVGRFEDPRSLYRARLLIRTREHPACPAQLRWSRYTTRFRIAPWYENGGRGPVRIPLPDLTSDSVRDLTPNVTFQVPQALFDMLAQNSPDSLIKGEGKEKKGGVELGWICSFNLPSIFLCAFIVLNLFLQLFDIIFQWMLFIKICIPYPKPKS